MEARTLTKSVVVTFHRLTTAMQSLIDPVIQTKGNITLEDLNNLKLVQMLPLMIILVVIMVTGLFGNSFVIVVYKLKMQKPTARVYIIALAIADLSVCVVGIPYHVLDLTFNLTYTNRIVCKALSFVMGFCTLSSVFILLVVGLDRYLKVCRPLKKQIKDFGDRKACVVAVMVALLVSLPNGVIYGNSTVYKETYNITGIECFIEDKYLQSMFAVGYLGFNLVIFSISVLFLLLIYGLIGRTIHEHIKGHRKIYMETNKKMCICACFRARDETTVQSNELQEPKKTSKEVFTVSTNEDGSQPDQSTLPEAMVRHRPKRSRSDERHTRKITLMMMTITIVFVLAYLPFICISILDSIDTGFWKSLTPTKNMILNILLRCYLINNIANPFIYCVWDVRFRQETVALLRKVCCGVASHRARFLQDTNSRTGSRDSKNKENGVGMTVK